MPAVPSYVFAAVGIALFALGVASIGFGEPGDQIIGALTGVIGVLNMIYGGLRRKTEDVVPAAATA